MKPSLPITILVLFAASLQAQDCLFRSAPGDNPIEPERFTFTCAQGKAEVGADGVCRLRRDKGPALRFTIPVPDEMIVQSVMHADCLGDLFLLYHVTDLDVGSGMAVRLGGPSLSMKWQTEIQAFNLGEPLQHGKFLYLTATGWVGKLNVETGEFVWQIKDLFGAQGVYTSFEKPVLKDSMVIFSEDKSNLGPRRTLPLQALKVDDATGKILSGAPAGLQKR